MTEQQFSQIEPTLVDGTTEPAAELWRNEVQSRIARYKNRRGRRIEGAFSMRFPFPAEEAAEHPAAEDAVLPIDGPVEFPVALLAATEPDESMAVGAPIEISTTSVEEAESPAEQKVASESVEFALEAVEEPEPIPFVDTVPRPRPKRKVIAFPRHLSVAPETVYRLADPVSSEVPRILDVPEELEAIPTTPFLDGLQLDPANPTDAMRDREHVELPFRAVPASQRVFAGMLDAAIAGVGVMVFAAVAYKIIPELSITKPLIMASVAMAGIVWGVYQYLFVVYAGRTFGMMAAKIRLRTFAGNSPNLRQRRKRALGFYLSALSLGMGLMWAFVDVDALCWHDRLSQTYLSNCE